MSMDQEAFWRREIAVRDRLNRLIWLDSLLGSQAKDSIVGDLMDLVDLIQEGTLPWIMVQEASSLPDWGKHLGVHN